MTQVEFNDSGTMRLFRYLVRLKTFPTSLKAASIVSRIPEKDIPIVLMLSIFEVKGDEIDIREVRKVG